jgi:hypothetical protein
MVIFMRMFNVFPYILLLMFFFNVRQRNVVIKVFELVIYSLLFYVFLLLLGVCDGQYLKVLEGLISFNTI